MFVTSTEAEAACVPIYKCIVSECRISDPSCYCLAGSNRRFPMNGPPSAVGANDSNLWQLVAHSMKDPPNATNIAHSLFCDHKLSIEPNMAPHVAVYALKSAACTRKLALNSLQTPYQQLWSIYNSGGQHQLFP